MPMINLSRKAQGWLQPLFVNIKAPVPPTGEIFLFSRCFWSLDVSHCLLVIFKGIMNATVTNLLIYLPLLSSAWSSISSGISMVSSSSSVLQLSTNSRCLSPAPTGTLSSWPSSCSACTNHSSASIVSTSTNQGSPCARRRGVRARACGTCSRTCTGCRV